MSYTIISPVLAQYGDDFLFSGCINTKQNTLSVLEWTKNSCDENRVCLAAALCLLIQSENAAVYFISCAQPAVIKKDQWRSLATVCGFIRSPNRGTLNNDDLPAVELANCFLTMCKQQCWYINGHLYLTYTLLNYYSDNH